MWHHLTALLTGPQQLYKVYVSAVTEEETRLIGIHVACSSTSHNILKYNQIKQL